MLSINLLPMPYVLAERTRRRLAGWAKWTGVVMTLMVAVSAGGAYALRPRATPVGERIEALQVQVREQGEALGAIGAQIRKTQVEVQAAQAVGVHPDYSVLLDVLARARQGQVALEAVEVKTVTLTEAPRPGVPKGAKPATRTEIQLELSGVAASPGEVPGYLLRLEESRLFATVTLVETSARPASGTHRTDLTAFKVKGVFSARAPGEGGKQSENDRGAVGGLKHDEPGAGSPDAGGAR